MSIIRNIFESEVYLCVVLSVSIIRVKFAVTPHGLCSINNVATVDKNFARAKSGRSAQFLKNLARRSSLLNETAMERRCGSIGHIERHESRCCCSDVLLWTDLNIVSSVPHAMYVHMYLSMYVCMCVCAARDQERTAIDLIARFLTVVVIKGNRFALRIIGVNSVIQAR